MSDKDYFFTWFFDVLYWFCRGKRRPVKLILTIHQIKGKIRGEHIMTNLQEGQKVKFVLAALDSKGRPAPIDGIPVWTNSNPGAADLALNPDQVSGEILYLDGGVAQISAVVDVRMGPEVKEITALADITCLPPEATVVELQLGTPEPITPV